MGSAGESSQVWKGKMGKVYSSLWDSMVRWSVEAEDHNWSDINYTYVWVVKDDYKTSVLPFSSKFYNYSSL